MNFINRFYILFTYLTWVHLYCIIFIIQLLLFIYNSDVLLCYGEFNNLDQPSMGELDERPISYDVYQTGMQSTSQGYRAELTGSNINSSNCNDLYDSSPNPNPNLNPNLNSNPNYVELGGRPINYQPYRPGLHNTTEGYRFEADGRPINYQPYHPGLHNTTEGYRFEVEGRPVNYHSNSYETGRNIQYSEFYNHRINDSTDLASTQLGVRDDRTDLASTQLGACEGMTDSEYFRDAARNNEALRNAYDPNANHSTTKCVYDVVKTGAKRIIKYVEDDLNKTRAEASERRSRIDALDTERFDMKRMARGRHNSGKYEQLYGSKGSIGGIRSTGRNRWG